MSPFSEFLELSWRQVLVIVFAILLAIMIAGVGSAVAGPGQVREHAELCVWCDIPPSGER